MEIRVSIPKGTRTTRQRLEIDEESFMRDLVSFIDERENKDSFNEELYQKILSYGVNKEELDNMINRLEIYSSYENEDKEEIGFPYENWVPKLLEYYN